jgi:hypothetical protein
VRKNLRLQRMPPGRDRSVYSWRGCVLAEAALLVATWFPFGVRERTLNSARGQTRKGGLEEAVVGGRAGTVGFVGHGQ